MDRSHSEDPDVPMISDLLKTLISEGKLTIAKLADALLVSEHSVYPYLVDREPRVSHLRNLLLLANREVATAIFTSLFQGLGAAIVWIKDEPELDADGDGDVDLADARKQAIEALEQLTALLRSLENLEPRAIAPIHIERLQNLSQAVVQHSMAVPAIYQHLAARASRRRRCRPLSTCPTPEPA